MKLRDYQEKIIKETKNYLNNKDNCIITLGMGGGKSLIISELSKIYEQENKQIVILLNVSELVVQIADHLDLLNLNYQIIKSGDTIKKKSNIHLIMEQSFHEKERLKNEIKCDILIKDEFHIGYGGKRYNDIINYLKPNKIIGLSGTPYDENGFLLKGFGKEDLITYGSTYELTKNGYLTPLKYFIPEWSLNIDYSKIKTTNDYVISELDKKINTIKHTKLILSSMEEMNAKKKKTLVYCNSIEHSNRVEKELKKNGYKVGNIHSENNSEKNKEIIKRFKLNKSEKEAVNCLVSVSKLTTGFNQPQAELLVLCRPTKILRLYLQIIFRVARLYEGKKYGEILDLSQCVATHGFGTQQQLFIKSNNTQKEKRKKTIESNIQNKILLEGLKKLKEKSSTNKEINEEELNLTIKELRIKKIDVKKTNTNDLMIIFENTYDIELVIAIKYEIINRMRKIDYNELNVLQEIEEYKYDYKEEIEKPTVLKQIKEKIKKEIKEM